MRDIFDIPGQRGLESKDPRLGCVETDLSGRSLALFQSGRGWWKSRRWGEERRLGPQMRFVHFAILPTTQRVSDTEWVLLAGWLRAREGQGPLHSCMSPVTASSPRPEHSNYLPFVSCDMKITV